MTPDHWFRLAAGVLGLGALWVTLKVIVELTLETSTMVTIITLLVSKMAEIAMRIFGGKD